MPSTIRAADQLLRFGCPTAIRRQVGDLLPTLASVECDTSFCGQAPMPAALLRDLVTVASRLTGHSWLAANADGPAACTGSQGTWQLPPLPELDRILSRALSDRFGLSTSAVA
jgi:hypothetical protein